MNQITEYFKQAELALAAYGDLAPGVPDIQALKSKDVGMTSIQAADFASKWTVIGTPYTDPLTGVSATIFQEIATGQKTLAIRGTQGLTDYLADYFILNGTPSQLNPQYRSLKTKVQAWLGDGTLTLGFSVTGHSLGGYLAAGLVADFSASISHAWLYNAPGNNSLVSQVMQALGIVATPDATKITSLRADAGISPVAGLGSNFSPPIPIHIENQFDPGLILSAPLAKNHSQQVLTDSLALYNLFATLDPNVSSKAITDILKAASNKAPDTLETALADVGKIFNKTYPAAATDRDTLYTNLYDLQGILKGTSAGLLTVTSFASKSVAELTSLAQSDIATRYALKELNTFAISGDDGLYQQFNAQNELDLYDPETGKGAMSEQWLKDRAVFALDKALANTADASILSSSENWTLTDKKTNYSISLTNGNWSLSSQLVFADDKGGTLSGGYTADHLYGGTGNDTLSGNGGSDYLEGGKGDDTLDGGSGDDQIWGGEGKDTLKGGDDNDKLYGGIGEDTIEGGAGADLIYGDLLDPDNTAVAYKDTLDGGKGNDRIYGGGGDDTIKGSEGGDYLYGDAGKDTVVGGDGQDYIEGGSEDDTLYGDGESEDDTSFKGTDKLFGDAGNDKLYGGDGQDQLNGGEGNDTLRGGKGADFLFGGTGADAYIYKSGDGADILYDEDGSGHIEYDETTLSGGKRENKTSHVWTSADSRFEYRTDGDPDSGPVTLKINGSITVLDFENGDLGIDLTDGNNNKPKQPKTPAPNPNNPGPAPRRDPLLLDLAGTGIQTVGLDAALYFDGNADGYKERTGWAGTGTGMLMLDLNEDGSLSNGGELFGDHSQMPNGMKAVDGFGALAQYDSNKDGKIDAQDPVYARLKVWQHAIGPDGQPILTDPDMAGQLVGLAELGITAIRLDSNINNTMDAQGNTRLRQTWIEMADGTQREIAEYNLAQDGSDTVAVNRVAVTPDIAMLPELNGYGSVPSLRQAMMLDTSGQLQGLVAAFATETDPAARNSLLEQLMYKWAGVDTLAPNSRGGAIDGRRVALLEKCYGLSLGKPTYDQGVQLNLTWYNLAESFNASLMADTRLSDLYNAIPYTWDAQGKVVKGDLTAVIAELQSELAANPDQGKQRLADFARSMRGYAMQDAFDYLAFRETFIEQDPGLAWTMDSAGLPKRGMYGINANGTETHFIGTDQAEAIQSDSNRGDGFINGENGSDVIYGSERSEYLINEDGDAVLMGGGGNDILMAGEGNDILDGGTGNDTLEGDEGDDTYLFRKGSGQDTIADQGSWFASGRSGGTDTVFLGGNLTPGEIKLKRVSTDLLLSIIGTSDTLTVKDFFNPHSNGVGLPVEVIRFQDGTSWDAGEIYSRVGAMTEGDDLIYGTAGDDSIAALGGEDVVYGLDGNDTLDGGNGNDLLAGGAGNDTQAGGSGDDMLIGGSASRQYFFLPWTADTGPNGNDTYLFGRGDGHDTVIDADPTPGNTDTIRFKPGVTPDDIAVSRPSGYLNNDLVLTIKDTGDSIIVKDWLARDTTANRVERVEFANGTIWDEQAIKQFFLTGTAQDDSINGFLDDDKIDGLDGNDTLFGLAGNDTINGDGGNDQLWGNAGDDTINGDAGDDLLYGNAGDDTLSGGDGNDKLYGDDYSSVAGNDRLYGGAGNDTLAGGNGSDVLDGGMGNDSLYGGDEVSSSGLIYASNRANGNDTYLFGRGYGKDTVYDRDRTPGNMDTIRLADDIAPADIVLKRQGDDLVLGISGTEDAMTVKNWFWNDSAEWRVEQIAFADGTLWDAETIRSGALIQGTPNNDILSGYETSDTIHGLGGSDVLFGNGGDDALDGGDGQDQLFGEAGNDILLGGAGNDTLIGGKGDDILDGGAGDDTLYGADAWINPYLPAALGNDTYRFGLGDGSDQAIDADGGSDRVEMKAGIAPDMVSVRRSGDDLVLSLNDADKLTLANWVQGGDRRIETVTFQDGIQWDETELMRRAVIGSDGNDTLIGFAGDDILTGGKGADILDGREGNNTYIFHAGDGQDTIVSTPGQDTLVFADYGSGAVQAHRQGVDLVLDIVGALDRVTVLNWFADEAATQGVQTVRFADGSEWIGDTLRQLVLTGTPDADALTGYATDDTFTGLQGDDTLAGGMGNDTYVYRRGDGHDTIIENDKTAGNEDILRLADLMPDEVTLFADGMDLVVSVNPTPGEEVTDTVRVAGWFARSAAMVERIVFADGSAWDAATIQSQASVVSDTDDYIVGSPNDDLLDGKGGNDTILAGDGNDILIGGRSDDILKGGTGDNQYLMGHGDGFDEIWTEPGHASQFPGYLDEVSGELAQLENAGELFYSDFWSNQSEYWNFGQIPWEIRQPLSDMSDGVQPEQARASLNALATWLSGGNDALVLGEGITAANLSVQYRPAGYYGYDGGEGSFSSSSRLAIGFGEEEGALIGAESAYDGGEGGYGGDAGFSFRSVRFADGSELTLDQLIAQADGGVIGTQYGEYWDDFLKGSVARDEIYGDDGNDEIDARGNADFVDGGWGDDAIAGGTGNDSLYGSDGNDILAGGKGADTLSGGQGNDVYAYNRGDDADRIDNWPGISWGDGDALSFGGGIRPEDITAYVNGNGELILQTGAEGDTLTLAWFVPYGGGLATNLDQTVSYAQFISPEGKARVFDLAGRVGGYQSLLRAADAENPVALFANAEDYDVTADIGPLGGGHALAYAEQGDLFAKPVEFLGSEGDDVVGGSVFSDTIDAGDGNNVIRAGDGDDSITACSGNDKIDGGTGNDFIDAGTGNDQVAGGSGDDTYVFSRGGFLSIDDLAEQGAGNRLVFKDAVADDLTLTADGNQFVLRVAGDGGEVQLTHFDPADPAGGHAVETYEFAAGTVLSYAGLLARGLELQGTEGADLLVGADGADHIVANGGDDLIVGGKGDDTLDGGSGDDFYVFNRGDGVDAIVDSASEFAPNTVLFGPDITVDDLWLSAESEALTVHVGEDGDALVLEGFDPNDTAGAHAVGNFRFADGTELSYDQLLELGFEIDGTPDAEELTGTDHSDWLMGREGDDKLNGGAGDDNYYYRRGDGRDTIIDSASRIESNTLEFGEGIGSDDLTLRLDNGKLILQTGVTGDDIELSGFDPADPYGPHAVESFRFADGAVLTYAELVDRGIFIAGSDGDDGLTGTAAHDVIDAGAGNDRLAGGKGGDALYGGEGDDTYVYNRGDGIVTIDDVAMMGEGNTLQFGKGITLDDMVRSLHFVAPTDDAPGDFIIRLGDAGDEIHLLGFDPEDAEFGTHAVETFQFADGSALNFRQMVRNTFVVQGDSGNEVLSGTNLSDRLYGYEGNDSLSGGLGDDVLTGGSGDDILAGGAGGDVYILDLGDGNDTLFDAAVPGENNLVVFGDGVTRDSLRFEQEAGGLRIRYSDADSVLLSDYVPADNQTVAQVEFADGSTASLDELMNRTPRAADLLPVQSATEDVGFYFQVPDMAFADPDTGDVLSFMATGANGSVLPEWLRFDPTIRTFSGTPANGDVGEFAVKVIAADRWGKTAEQIFNLAVANVNDAPVAMTAIGDQLALEDVPFAFQLSADTFADVDAGDALSYSATLDDGLPLPAWLAFDPATLTFSGTPANSDVGVMSLKVTATDQSGTSASSLFDLGVVNTNDAPVAASPLADLNAAEDTAFSFMVPTDAFTDMDAGDALAYTATLADGTPLPQWLVFDPATRTFSGTPANEDVGSLDVTVTATDLVGASASGTFVLAISNVNDAPTLVQAVADQATTEDAPFSFTVPADTFTDADFIHGDSLSYSATMAGGSALPSWLSFDAVTQTFGGTPVNADVGTVQVKVIATDTGGLAAGSAFSIAVDNVNDIPVLAIPLADRQAAVKSAVSWQIPAGSFADVDQGDALSFSAQLADGSALPSWLAFDAATQTFSGRVPNNAMGGMDVRVIASDGHGAESFASDVFRVNFTKGSCGGHGNEGVGNRQDAPPPGHDHDWNDGPGTSPGHPGSKDGRHSKHGKDGAHDDDHDEDSGWNGRNKLFRQLYLDPKKLDQHYEEFAGKRKEADTCATVARWIEVDLAVSRRLAMEDKSLPWLHHNHGADIAALHQASAGFLGSKNGYGVDAVSLVAAAPLKTFRGLGEGMERIG